MGGSFEAFVWAKNSRIGSHPAKLVLIMMADKVNAKFELYPSKTELADDSEMSKRTLDKWLDYLHHGGFVTLIERVRANGSTGRTQMLVNHPKAPHMNGEPIELDYKGARYYPKYPEALRTAGFSWVSGDVLNAERLDTEQPSVRGAKPAPPGVQDLHGGGAEPAPYGSAEPAPLNSNPRNSPTNQDESEPSGTSPEAREVGWLDSKKKIPNTPGARYLMNLAFPSGQGFGAAAIRALHEHTTALLASGWTEQGITEEITNADGAGKVNSWPGFARPKLVALRPIPADADKPGTKTGVDLPPWCGECGDPSDPRRELKCTNNIRTRVWPDGTPCSCRTADVSAA